MSQERPAIALTVFVLPQNKITFATSAGGITLFRLMNSTNAMSTNAVPEITTGFRHFWHNTNHIVHIVIIVLLAFLVHYVVSFIRDLSEKIITKSYEKRNPLGFMTQQPKFITLSRLIVSAVTFLVYAFAIYLIISLEFPSDNLLKTYVGSAAVIGLALSFGVQGMVQDIVACITLILSDAMDAGDIVDLTGGVIGRVERIGLRFTQVINFYNQVIFVPNRTITNVSRFPYRGILAYADVQIPEKADQQVIVETIQRVAKGIQAQFSGVILTEPVFSKVQTTPGNWNYLRIQFKIWPGQNSIIDTTFSSQMAAAMRTFDPNYAAWQIVVTYRALAS